MTPVDDDKVDPVPWKTEVSYNMKYVQQYEAILNRVCEDQNIPLIELMSEFMSKNFKTLLIDGVHLNTDGHLVIYEQVKKYLLEKNLL